MRLLNLTAVVLLLVVQVAVAGEVGSNLIPPDNQDKRAGLVIQLHGTNPEPLIRTMLQAANIRNYAILHETSGSKQMATVYAFIDERADGSGVGPEVQESNRVLDMLTTDELHDFVAGLVSTL